MQMKNGKIRANKKGWICVLLCRNPVLLGRMGFEVCNIRFLVG
jgi:hypothetical protein